MTKARPSRYVHLLRAMRAGDVLYLPEHQKRLDRAIVACVDRAGGDIETAVFAAVNSMLPEQTHRVVRVTCLKPLRDLP